MAFDNFIARAASDTSHPFYPLPESTRDSYLPENGDGQPTTAVVNAASSEVSSAGRRTQQTAWAAKLKSSLTVTDTPVGVRKHRLPPWVQENQRPLFRRPCALRVACGSDSI